MNNKEVKKLTLAATLTALSIVLDIIFKVVIPGPINNTFGFPYYAVPVVIGSLILGPVYGGVMGYLSDLVGFFAFPLGFAYDPLFALSAIMWGVLPWFLAKTNSNWKRVTLSVFITHIAATAINTVAMWIGYGFAYATANLTLRLMMIPANVIIIAFATVAVNTRLEPIYIDFTKKTSSV